MDTLFGVARSPALAIGRAAGAVPSAVANRVRDPSVWRPAPAVTAPRGTRVTHLGYSAPTIDLTRCLTRDGRYFSPKAWHP
jgi:hypothetical protein